MSSGDPLRARPRPPQSAARTLPTPSARHPLGGRLRAAAALLAVLLAVVLTGCGLRWETPPPPEPTPDAAEQARQRAAADSVSLSVVAERATPGVEPDVADQLAFVAEISATHLEALGGLAPARPTPSTPASPTAPAPSATPTAATEPEDVLIRLLEAYETARADAISVPDGPLARLLASIATSRLLAARDLARVTDLDVPRLPRVDLGDPATLTGHPDAPEAPEAPDGGMVSDGATPEGEDTLGDDTAGDGPTGAGTTPAPGTTGSAGIADAEAARAMVLAHDQAGYAFEVIAARLSDDWRDRARSRARVHRAAAEAWAAATGVVGTDQDPREVAYDLPPEVLDGGELDVGRDVELQVAADYAALIARAGPGRREALVDALAVFQGSARSWRAQPTALPGLVEHGEV